MNKPLLILQPATSHDPHYGARFGPSAWGVQFHPELDCEIIDRCIDTYASAMTAAGFLPHVCVHETGLAQMVSHFCVGSRR